MHCFARGPIMLSTRSRLLVKHTIRIIHEYLFYLNINCILRQCMYIYPFHTYSDFIYIMFIWWFYFHLNGSDLKIANVTLESM